MFDKISHAAILAATIVLFASAGCGSLGPVNGDASGITNDLEWTQFYAPTRPEDKGPRHGFRVINHGATTIIGQFDMRVSGESLILKIANGGINTVASTTIGANRRIFGFESESKTGAYLTKEGDYISNRYLYSITMPPGSTMTIEVIVVPK